ncbi:partial DNA primase, partial [Anaerolineae bacterium]
SKMQQITTTTKPQIKTTTRPMREPTPQRATRSTRDDIETVRSNNPIEQVIGRYVELKPSGRRLSGRCPFHDDPTPSFVVYVHNQSWYCFGCDIGGDVFRFVERIEHLSFVEALQRLGSNSLPERRITHSLPPQVKPVPMLELSDEHFTLLTAATEVYHAAIFMQTRVLEYLAKRRIDLDMIRRHRIGFATGNDLAKYFRFRGWDPEIANDLGLLGPHGDYFRQRIVVPELRGGRAIYLVGRATQKYQRAKYLGLPGAPKPLYGLETIQRAKDVFVCEGPVDWLTLVEWGYPAIALLGSHLKQDQISEMADAERIFIVTDSDEPGRKSAHQLAETFGKRARIVPCLPNVKDVNELAMKPNGQSVFARLVEQACCP